MSNKQSQLTNGIVQERAGGVQPASSRNADMMPAGLADLPETFRPIVTRLLDERPEPIGSGAALKILPIRYVTRPYSSLLHFAIQFPSRSWRGYIKIEKCSPTLEPNSSSPEVQLRQQFELLKRLQPLFKPQDPVGIVRPVAWFGDYPALVTEEIPGRTVYVELSRCLGISAGDRDVERMEQVCRRCGLFLKRFQDVNLQDDDTPFSLKEMRAYIDRRLQNIVHRGQIAFDESSRTRLLKLIDRLSERVDTKELRVAQIHGDFTPANIMLSDGRVVVLDFAMSSYGNVLHDVAHFHHQLHLWSLHPRWSARRIGRLQQAFLDGYGCSDSSNPLFTLFRVQHVTCQLSRLSRPSASSILSRTYDRYVIRRQLRWLNAIAK